MWGIELVSDNVIDSEFSEDGNLLSCNFQLSCCGGEGEKVGLTRPFIRDHCSFGLLEKEYTALLSLLTFLLLLVKYLSLLLMLFEEKGLCTVQLIKK